MRDTPFYQVSIKPNDIVEDRPMSKANQETVWISDAPWRSPIGDRQGLSNKYFGEEWQPSDFVLPLSPKHVGDNLDRHVVGETLKREEMVEASYVFAPNNWKRVGDLFTAGAFYAVKGRLAEVLKDFDLGTGGLIEFPIYEADKTTRLPGPFYLLNFGCIKDTFVASKSKKLRRPFDGEPGLPEWGTYDIADGDLAFTRQALEGPDLWFERNLYSKTLLSDRLHDAIVKAKVKTNFRFVQGRIV
ncbi:MAG: hypothetical protein O9333_13065 [Beijerinckiaceae bacterium]|nr:hypothetical protein [Beijerinckiaceae bacterium]